VTELEWEECDDPRALVLHMSNRNPRPPWGFYIPGSEFRWLVNERKRRLIGTACCARFEHLLPPAARDLLHSSWRVADYALGAQLTLPPRPGFFRRQFQSRCTVWAIEAVCHLAPLDLLALIEDVQRAVIAETSESVAWGEEMATQAQIVRCVVGNPFLRTHFDRAWATDTAKTLAQQMYDSREFGAMPILADALQDAGCENDDILAHCRDPHATHVRGCWVCDLVLGKA